MIKSLAKYFRCSSESLVTLPSEHMLCQLAIYCGTEWLLYGSHAIHIHAIEKFFFFFKYTMVSNCPKNVQKYYCL